MIRVVLAVLLATALLSISLPAIETASQERSATQMERVVDRIAVAAGELREEDPGPTLALAPKRTVTVRLPTRSLTAARVEQLTITDGDDGPARISYTITGRPRTAHAVDAPIVTPFGPVVLREPGERTLVLRLLRRGQEPVIVVSEQGQIDEHLSPLGAADAPQASVDSPVHVGAPEVQIPERGHAVP